MRVLVFGEILWDLIDGRPYLGGAPFNFAAHIARCNNEVSLVSSVGDDNLGWRALSEANRLSVDCSYVKIHRKAPTGTVDVFLKDGEPDYTIIENVAFDEIVVDEDLFVNPNAFDILYMGTLAQRKPVSAETLRRILSSMHFKHIFYDVNLRKGGWKAKNLHDSLNACTILKLNVSEVSIVSLWILGEQHDTEAFCKRIAYVYENISIVIVTAGADGCFVFDKRRFIHSPAVPVTTVDAIGAGDAFSAAFMHTYLQTGGDFVKAANIANHIGAFVTGSRGAVPDYPAEIVEVLKAANLR